MIGVIIPDRTDRPEFLRNCLRLIGKQTRRPDRIFLMNHSPKDDQFDLTKRVRRGFERANKAGCTAVLIMENDDFYHETYIERMVKGWINEGAPTLYGHNKTLYYHIIKNQHSTIHHPGRASLMNTLISCRGPIDWPEDSEIFLDLYLWKKYEGVSVQPEKNPICIGIKHGVGKCGGSGHNRMQFRESDPRMTKLQKWTGDDFNFYRSKRAKMLTDN